MFRSLTALGFSNPRGLSPFSPRRTHQECLCVGSCPGQVRHTGACISCPACQLYFFFKKSYSSCSALNRKLTGKTQILYYSQRGHNHRYVVTAHSVTRLLCVKALPFKPLLLIRGLNPKKVFLLPGSRAGSTVYFTTCPAHPILLGSLH